PSHPSQPAPAARSAQAQGGPLDRGAGVHHHLQARRGRAQRRRVVDHAGLQPYGPSPDRDRSVHHVPGQVGVADDAPHIPPTRDIGQARVTLLPVHFLSTRMHRDDLLSQALLQVGGDVVSAPGTVLGESDHGPASGGGQQALNHLLVITDNHRGTLRHPRPSGHSEHSLRGLTRSLLGNSEPELLLRTLTQSYCRSSSLTVPSATASKNAGALSGSSSTV